MAAADDVLNTTNNITTTASTANSSHLSLNTPENIANTLLAGLNCTNHIHLIIGANPLAATRCTQALRVGAIPILIAPETADLHYSLQRKVDDGSVRWERRSFTDEDLFRLGRPEVGHVVDAVFVTAAQTPPLSQPHQEGIAVTIDRVHISELCKRNRIPINVVDAPHLCTFSLLSTHIDGPLQIGVTTNGRGCKLASRIRREIAASLPQDLGAACERLGEVRRRIQQQQKQQQLQQQSGEDIGDLDDSVDQGPQFNKLITDTEDDARTRRMRWLSQVCEYWPLKKLAAVGDEDVVRLLAAYTGASEPGKATTADADADAETETGADISTSSTPGRRRMGRIILAGSGPGHPSLLTVATRNAIQAADLILADKLVPSAVLDLIPRRTPVHIARKFPGNADAAQEELLSTALAAAREGKLVLRLKQGDPFIYGRGGEELAYFRAADERLAAPGAVVVLPGVTSALSAPLFAAIPATQRDVADQILICTGTGKKGKPPAPPEYVASRTVVFLMALHRITGLIRELTTHIELDPPPPTTDLSSQTSPDTSPTEKPTININPSKPSRALWPLNTPCTVIERASCPDQRVIRTTLAHVAEAIETEGSRPPGLLVVGAACEFLHKPEEGKTWVVEEGFRGLDEGLAVDMAGLGLVSEDDTAARIGA